jgi:hypothetical protein
MGAAFFAALELNTRLFLELIAGYRVLLRASGRGRSCPRHRPPLPLVAAAVSAGAGRAGQRPGLPAG